MGFIYKIENLVNKKLYIGQTSKTIAERWGHHKNDALTSNATIYKAIRKYGIDNFKISIIEECHNDLLNEREIYWIKFYDTFNNGYNETIGGSGGQKYRHEDIIEKYYEFDENASAVARYFNCSLTTVISILKANNISKNNIIEMIDPQTLKTIKVFDSLTEASEYKDEWNIGTLSAALNGTRNSAYGYFWKRFGEEKTFKPLLKQNRSIVQYDKDMNYLNTFQNCKEANKFLNKKENSQSIRNALNGRSKTAFGYIWKYKDEVDI